MFRKITPNLETRKLKNLLLTTLLATTASYAQVGVGTTNPNASAALEVYSTDKVFLPPRLTEAQMNAMANPPEGGLVYCTDCSSKGMYFYDGNSFLNITGTEVAGITAVTGSGGATWLDRNLGATQVATSLTDADAYGNLYQWGRNSDGHQIRTSSTSTGPVASGNEGANFITVSGGDWLSVSDNTRWNGSTKGTHDPCPMGYRLPTEAEWNTERLAWSSNNAAGAFASPLKLTQGGQRSGSSALITLIGFTGRYWTSTSNGSLAKALDFNPGAASVGNNGKIQGYSIRCIQE